MPEHFPTIEDLIVEQPALPRARRNTAYPPLELSYLAKAPTLYPGHRDG